MRITSSPAARVSEALSPGRRRDSPCVGSPTGAASRRARPGAPRVMATRLYLAWRKALAGLGRLGSSRRSVLGNELRRAWLRVVQLARSATVTVVGSGNRRRATAALCGTAQLRPNRRACCARPCSRLGPRRIPA